MICEIAEAEGLPLSYKALHIMWTSTIQPIQECTYLGVEMQKHLQVSDLLCP